MQDKPQSRFYPCHDGKYSCSNSIQSRMGLQEAFPNRNSVWTWRHTPEGAWHVRIRPPRQEWSPIHRFSDRIDLHSAARMERPTRERPGEACLPAGRSRRLARRARHPVNGQARVRFTPAHFLTPRPPPPRPPSRSPRPPDTSWVWHCSSWASGYP
jgi:hypothetical protein